MNLHRIAVLCFSVALVGSPALGQDLSAYRGVNLGDGLQKVIGATGASPTDIKLVHERPVLMQELEWRLRALGGSIVTNDPVQRVVFSFYHDQLYRILVTYERARIDGLTDADLVDSLSSTYGAPLTSEATKALRPSETPDLAEQYRVVARWENAEHSIVLLRGAYLVPLSLVMLAKHVATDARHADLEATRLNLSEQPAREALKAREAAEAQRLAQEKVRPANKAAFKP
jgi:hypothetical protein